MVVSMCLPPPTSKSGCRFLRIDDICLVFTHLIYTRISENPLNLFLGYKFAYNMLDLSDSNYCKMFRMMILLKQGSLI